MEEHNPIIEHIVISGGVIYGFVFYGILKQLNLKKEWNIQNIKTIHATSAGTIISTIIALKYDWNIMDKYLIQRPITEIIKFDLSTILNCFQMCGLFGIDIFKEYFENLFSGKDLPISTTLKEFYEKTQIETHYFTTSLLNKFEIVDISHKTHPEWTVIEAMYASCAFPILFSPLFKDGEIYCDGGFLCNYPIEYCKTMILNSHQQQPDITKENSQYNESILGITIDTITSFSSIKKNTSEQYSLFDYILLIICNVLYKLSFKKIQSAKNEIVVKTDYMTMFNFQSILSSDLRSSLINPNKEYSIFNNDDNSQKL